LAEEFALSLNSEYSYKEVIRILVSQNVQKFKISVDLKNELIFKVIETLKTLFLSHQTV
jgi:hypothetical protein